YSQKQLADEIDDYDWAYNSSAAGSSNSSESWSSPQYCKALSGSVYFAHVRCFKGDHIIAKSEYERLKGQKSVSSIDPDSLSGRSYCRRPDGRVFRQFGSCGQANKITKTEYDRAQDSKPTPMGTSTASSGIKYCGREDGSVFRAWDNCGKTRQITDFEYYDEVEARTANIKTWLKSIGLERYEPEFRRNDITLDIISELTDSDLKEIGIKSLGARKRILKAAK
ncbi:MAG: hypothetical protein HN333_13335, partial [Rhodospirillaceae bacterium]|nr:hypothetical protein [Rhodospirillaceae bacterium]